MSDSPRTTPFAIAFGSNLGEREATLARALEAVDALPGTEIRATSSMYSSEPWGDTEQPEFRNAVAFGHTSLSPTALLENTQSIERELGKKVIRKWGPRLIDLDLLLYGDSYINSPGIQIPHPRIQSRPFVYLPLAEIASHPEWPHQWNEYLSGNSDGIAIEPQTHRLSPVGYWPAAFSPRSVLLTSESESSTSAIGELLGRAATGGEIFALKGLLGAGKSCLARGIARGLGETGPIPSPTYTLCREYDTARLPFHHWDFYRLIDGGDLKSTAFAESAESGAVLAVEWADLFSTELPAERTTWIEVTRGDAEELRTIQIQFPPRSLALRRAWAEALPHARSRD